MRAVTLRYQNAPDLSILGGSHGRSLVPLPGLNRGKGRNFDRVATRALGAALVTLLSLSAATYDIPHSSGGPARDRVRSSAPGAGPTSQMKTYGGLASWVDMYNKGPWKYPERTASRMAQRGAATLLLQTSNYRKRRDVYRPSAMSRLLEAAHANGMKVVAWYLPSYAHARRDWRRTKAAVTFTSTNGQNFDGFAMDIESTAESNIAVRNRRAIALSDRLRAFVGKDHALGAIIPDPVTQRFWPNFPYKRLSSRYDVFLPMAYWTFRTRGERRVHRYTRDALEIIRTKTNDEAVPVHVIGGIASDASTAEVRGFAKAAVRFDALGASLYDYPITSDGQWDQLQRVK